MFFTILAACFKSKSSVFVVQSFTLRGEVNKTGRPVLTGFYYFLIIPNINIGATRSSRKGLGCLT